MRQKQKQYKANLERTVGKARIGGPFMLMNHLGKPVCDADFAGKFMLIYFGFTNCPDVCPTELKKMAAVIARLDKTDAGPMVQPLFITIDPLRDTVKQVAEYVKDFHPRLMGLTGPPDAMAKLCKAYRIYFSKAWEDAGEKSGDDYLVDHSIILYLMDHRGEFLDFFGANATENQILEKISERVEKHLYPNGRTLWNRLVWFFS